MKNFIDHEKLDSEGFKNLKKPGEELFIDSLSRCVNIRTRFLADFFVTALLKYSQIRQY